MTVKV